MMAGTMTTHFDKHLEHDWLGMDMELLERVLKTFGF